MAASEMSTPGTVVYRETIEALTKLRRAAEKKSSAGASTLSWSDADVATIRKIARRQKQRINHLHNVWRGKPKYIFEHAREV